MRYAELVGVALATTLAVTLAGPAMSAEGVAAGGSGTARVKGEADGYRIATAKSPVTLQARGPGDLTLKIRAVLPAGSIPSEGAKVRILDNGTELGHLSLSIYSSGTFSDHAEVVPSGSSGRSFHLGEGTHVVTVESKGGSAAISMHWKGKHVRRPGHPVDTLDSSSDLTATPLSEPAPSGLVAAPLDAAPLAPAPLQPAPRPAPMVQVAPAQQPVPEQALAPYSSSPAVSSSNETSRSPLPLVFVGAAALCAIGSGVAIGLAVSQDGSYNSTPENNGTTATNRGGKLSTANSELAAGEILGATAAAFLVATGVSLLF